MKQLCFLTTIHLFACIFLLLSGCAQDTDYTQWELPEGAKLRIGKGRITDLKFSPDGRLLAVATSVGIWLYDTETYAPRNLIKGAADAIAFFCGFTKACWWERELYAIYMECTFWKAAENLWFGEKPSGSCSRGPCAGGFP